MIHEKKSTISWHCPFKFLYVFVLDKLSRSFNENVDNEPAHSYVTTKKFPWYHFSRIWHENVNVNHNPSMHVLKGSCPARWVRPKLDSFERPLLKRGGGGFSKIRPSQQGRLGQLPASSCSCQYCGGVHCAVANIAEHSYHCCLQGITTFWT